MLTQELYTCLCCMGVHHVCVGKNGSVAGVDVIARRRCQSVNLRILVPSNSTFSNQVVIDEAATKD